jgi:hypothetical protein
VLDSGCTQHMTGNGRMFTSIDDEGLKYDKITFGDNSKGKVKGLGKIVISNDLSILNVLLVESLSYNLLFVAQLSDLGLICKFPPKDVVITSIKSDELIFKGFCYGNLHLVDFSSNDASLSTCLFTKLSKGRLRPGHYPADATPGLGPPLSLSLSCSASTRRPPLRAPSPPLPFKTEPPPPGQIFLAHTSFVSSIHAQVLHTRPPLPRHPPHRLPTTRAPPSRRTPPERRRRPPPSGERLLSCSIPQSTAASSPRWSPSSYRTPPRASTTTEALSSLTPATASALTPPLCPVPPLRLPGATPRPHWCSPATPSHRPAPAVSPSSASPRRRTRKLRAVTAQ